MRVIIAYDGSTHADEALDDLAQAGFPRNCEILVASVADFSNRPPTISEFDLLSAASRRIDRVLEQVKHHEVQVLKKTRNLTSKVVHRLRRRFPCWRIYSDVLKGKPADALLKKAADWRADLIMGGTQGRSAIGRFFHESVSLSVAENSRTSVRIVRHAPQGTDEDKPLEIILAAKNHAEAERIVGSVDKRSWPAKTRIRLVIIDEGVSRVGSTYFEHIASFESIAGRLRRKGLRVSVHILEGKPLVALSNAAAAFGASMVFAASGTGYNQPGLDWVASDLVKRSLFTVEIVR